MDNAQVLLMFGKQLQAARQANGWSQEKLAFEAGLDRTYVSSVERGRRNLSLINICKLAKALGVAPQSLLLTQDGKDE